jgi:molybdate transport system ATP-binding protein
MKAVQVADLAQKRLADVSSGMQRLFLLIRAFIKNPPLLIFDEPCQGLDEFQTESFINLVDDICRQTDVTIIYISHYENEVPECVSHCLNLDLGDYGIGRISKHYSSNLLNLSIHGGIEI